MALNTPVSPPPRQRRPMFRLSRSTNTPSAALQNANKLLHTGDVEGALRVYTETLTKIAPGHPAAYMNRCVCYIALEQPHLAVMDAQRALIGAHHAETGYLGNPQAEQVIEYADDCEEAAKRKEPWATTPSPLLTRSPDKSPNELHTHLARLSVSRRKILNRTLRKSSGEHPLHDLRMKSIFRLAQSLWRCQGGAFRSALHVVDMGLEEARRWQDNGKEDEVRRVNVKEDDCKQFHKLGNQIMLDFEGRFENEEKGREAYTTTNGTKVLTSGPLDDLAANDLATNDLSGLMRTRYTMAGNSQDARQVYGDDLKALRDTNDCIRRLDLDSFVELIKPNEASANLVAVSTKDLGHGSVLFRETTAFRCSTRNNDEDSLVVFCHSCCAKLDIPEPILVRLYSGAATTCAERKATFDLRPMSATPPLEYTAAPPETSKKLRNSDVQIFGASTSEAVFCSQACRQLGDLRTSDLEAEHYLRLSTNTATHLSAPYPPHRLLQALMLLRLIGRAEKTGVKFHDLPALRLLQTCNRPRAPQSAWSYASHVLQPLEILQATDMGWERVKSTLNAAKSDGSVINEMMSMIEQHMHVSRIVRWIKIYDEEGHVTLVEPFGHKENPDNGPPTWYGALHPLCGLLDVAVTPAQANVELVDIGNATIVCLPLVRAQLAIEPLIKASTPLLLATRDIRLATVDEMHRFQDKATGPARPRDVYDGRSSTSSSSVDIADTMMAYERSASEDDVAMLDVEDSEVDGVDDVIIVE